MMPCYSSLQGKDRPVLIICFRGCGEREKLLSLACALNDRHSLIRVPMDNDDYRRVTNHKSMENLAVLAESLLNLAR